MLKINASFSKKVPIEGTDYSSQSYHATIESELPDGLTAGQIKERIHQTFDLVRSSVEEELSQTGGPARPEENSFTRARAGIPSAGSNSYNSNGSGRNGTASPKQLDYLRDLGARQGWSKAQLDRMVQERHNVSGVNELTRNQASALIDELTETGRRSAKSTGRAA